ncbi:MAG: hypothetical protein GQF41_1974 [Candidatus Rifleibacterium amylolyticum]|nr:MAG: hypothetical protein GQF41_1974 [Candidatus Rifleibacterium amylolyticum]
MDGLKLPIILLVVVLALGVFLFNPFAPPKKGTKVQPEPAKVTEPVKSPEEVIKSAQAALEKSDFEQVVKLLEPHRNSADFEIQRLLGFGYSGVKRFDPGIVAFEKALEQRKIPEVGYSLVYLYEITGRVTVARMLYEDLRSAKLPPRMERAVYEGLARTSAFENDPRQTLKYNYELIKKYPDSPEGYVALIKLFRHLGHTRDLPTLIKAGDVHQLENFDYNFWLGTIYFDTGNFDEALKRFQRCIKLNPANSTPYYYSYRILKRQKNIEQALKELEKYHRLNPLLPHIFFEAAIDAKNEGKILLAYRFLRSALTMDRILLGRDDKGAMQAVERQIKSKGSELDKKFLTAFMNYVNGDYKIAREQIIHLTEAVKGTEYEDDARRVLRECDLLEMQDVRYQNHVRELQRQKELENAARMQEMTVKTEIEDETEADLIKRKAMMNPNDLRLQYAAGLKLARMGHIADAKRFLDSAIRLNPNILEPNYSMAKILIHEDNLSEARSYIDRALKINPNNSQTLSISADLYLRNQDFSQAKSHAEGALKTNPNNGEARLVLAQIDLKNGDNRGALQQLNMGLEVERDPERRQQMVRLKESLK